MRITNKKQLQDMVKIRLPNIEVVGEYTRAKDTIECRCNVCHQTFYPTADRLKYIKGCPICSGRKGVKDYNDIPTLRPDLLKYLKNPEDAIGVRPRSGKIVECVCPICGHEKKIRFAELSTKPFSCLICGHGISYPEKIMRGVLTQLNVSYKTEKKFEWGHNKKYDFYLPKYQCIIETHGIQHYQNHIFNKSLEDEQNNDKFKYTNAMNNGIEKYIVIDCSLSDINWIKNNILKSDLKDMFDLSNIDWDECEKYYNIDKKNKILELWNSGQCDTVNDISKKLNLSSYTVRSYLEKLSALKLCNYDPKDCLKKTLFKKDVLPHNIYYIKCMETNRVFNGFKDVAIFLERYCEEDVNIDVRNIKKSCIEGTDIYGLHFMRVILKPYTN